ncbi:hypothetical protein TWF696_008738 [Orbilia brochopaga]|uniref:Uncharacterized protein n=1 Tax=Orbilia brochopaga TaxID=3140254 RepID=A0AAV9ULA9_9PEZI
MPIRSTRLSKSTDAGQFVPPLRDATEVSSISNRESTLSIKTGRIGFHDGSGSTVMSHTPLRRPVKWSAEDHFLYSLWMPIFLAPYASCFRRSARSESKEEIQTGAKKGAGRWRFYRDRMRWWLVDNYLNSNEDADKKMEAGDWWLFMGDNDYDSEEEEEDPERTGKLAPAFAFKCRRDRVPKRRWTESGATEQMEAMVRDLRGHLEREGIYCVFEPLED